MARIDFRLDREKVLQLDPRIILRVLIEEFNRLRTKAGMPPLTLEMVVTRIKEIARTLEES